MYEKSKIKIGYNTIIPIEILTKKNNFKTTLNFKFNEEKIKIEEPIVIKKEINVIPKMPTKVVKLLPVIGLKKETVVAKKNDFKSNLNFKIPLFIQWRSLIL